jgi:hypothetical protein
VLFDSRDRVITRIAAGDDGSVEFQRVN